ncbi:MAG: hypothetical protein R3300_19310 [Candidatus Promineifilaceae bacterium]|nr:hypothetical protein [Candidatus Promineifilaceae bacterium]
MSSDIVRKIYGPLLRWASSLAAVAASVRRWLAVGLVSAVLLLPAGSDALTTGHAVAVPTFTVTAVERDAQVTIRTSNFPADHTFTVTMGPMGSRGIDGYVVGTVDSGDGGSLEATLDIPAALHGATQIAIRLQSGGVFPYFSYNWFYNRTTGEPPSAPEDDDAAPEGSGYQGIPTFSTVDVVADNSVTIRTHNFPAGETFNVTMGAFGTRGIGGISVGTLDSGSGGELEATYNIPADLAGTGRIAIRVQTDHADPYFAYNWFYNNSTADDTNNGNGADNGDDADNGSGGSSPSTYTGIPTITIEEVTRNDSVTLRTHNFPANQTFTVRMGPFGTRGIGGMVAAQIDSGDGSDMSVTVPIPESVHGLARIAIRLQTAHAQPYFAYNWFYNTSTP